MGRAGGLLKRMSKDQSRDTGMAMVLLALMAYVSTGQRSFVWAAIVLLVVNMTAPLVFRPVAVVWFGLAHILGTAVSSVVLSALFLVVVTPVGVVRRLMKKDTLKLRSFKADAESGMIERNHTFTGPDMETPY